MSDSYKNSSLSWDDESWAILERAIERVEAAWRRGETPKLLEFVPVDHKDPRYCSMLARLIIVDQECRSIAGCPQPLDSYLREYPELKGKPELFEVPEDSQTDQIDASKEAVLWKTSEDACSTPRAEDEVWELRVLCPECRKHIQVTDEVLSEELCCPKCGHRFSLLQGGAPVERTEDSGLRLKRMIAHFHLLEQLGMGAFGSVWKARDTDLDRIVALKIPRGDHLSPEEVERFFREARAAAQFRHPNLVGVQAVGREGNQLYIVSDFIEGLPLDAWRGEQQLEFRQTAELVHKIASAMQAAHGGGVIHRDLKPQNILIDSDDEPCIVDFGMAKRHLEAELTSEGQTLGTPLYMSPEQASGGSKDVDRRSDVYAIGIILYELLTGTTPFKGSTLEVCQQHLESEPPSPRKINGQIPRDLETICLQCLEKEPDRRYQTAQELADELKRYLAGEPIKARPSSALNRAWRWSMRRPLIASLSGALFLAVLTISILLLIGPGQIDSPIVVDEQFSESELNTELWDGGQTTYGSSGKHNSQIRTRDGQLTILAEAEHERGWSCVQDTWADLKYDLKELNQDLIVDVDLAARGEIGAAAVLFSSGKKPEARHDPDSVVLLMESGDPNKRLRMAPRFLRIYISRSECLAIFEKRSEGLDVVDLSHLDKWLLRFYVTAGTSAGLPPDKVSLTIDRIRVSKLQGESAVVGRVVNAVTNRGVGGIDVDIGPGKHLVTTNANGYYFTKSSAGETEARIESKQYHQVADCRVLIDPGAITKLDIGVRQETVNYGDVISSIPFEHDRAQGLAVVDNWAYIAAVNEPEDLSLYRIDLVSLSEKRRASMSPVCSLASVGERLLAASQWPGRVYEILPNDTLTIVGRLPMDWPRGMAFDGKRVWLIETPQKGSHAVHVVNRDSWSIEATVASPEYLTGAIAAAPDMRIWVACKSGGVFELDGSVVKSGVPLEFPAEPRFAGNYDHLSFCDGVLWGIDNEAKRLCKINLSAPQSSY